MNMFSIILLVLNNANNSNNMCITMIVHSNFLEAYTVNSAGRRSSDMKGGKAFFTLYFIVMSEFFHNKPILSL